MQPKIYKAIGKLENILEEVAKKGYNQIGEERENKDLKVKMRLLLDLHEKQHPEWLTELLSCFQAVDIVEKRKSNQYNAIIIVETQNSIYLVPKGRAYLVIEKFSDLNFGLNFAEKTIKTQNITMKSVGYMQRNKMREITNYKQSRNEFPQASESYFMVSGKPELESIFGANLECGTAVSLAKDYSLINEKSMKNFLDLFNKIDIAMSKDAISSIPKFIKLPKKGAYSEKLDDELIKNIKKENGKGEVFFNINKIQLLGSSLEILNNEMKLYIYTNRLSEKSMKRINLDEKEIEEYIRINSTEIQKINQIKFAIYNQEDECLSKNLTIKDLAYCEIEKDDKLYVLDNGYWCYLNEAFYMLLKEKLDEITNIVFYPEEYDIEYDSYEVGEFSGEGGYIESLTKKRDLTKLHKRNLNISGNTIEVADVYNNVKDELAAIKRGTDTSKAMYSFEQSVLSIQVLANHNEFKVEEELLKYNDRKKYKNVDKYPLIEKHEINKIINCKNVVVLWLIDDSVKYIFENIKKKEMNLNDFNSLLLKLKLNDWYSFAKDRGYNPKLYFTLDRPNVILKNDVN